MAGGLFIAVPSSLIVADALGDPNNIGYPLAGVFVGVGLGLLRLAGLDRR
jgi:hypothetical protein